MDLSALNLPRLVSASPPGIKKEREIRVFVKVRNEAERLPYFLDYYRRLGAHRLIFVENSSTDHTLDLLRGEPDVHCYTVDGSFAAAQGGQAWLNYLLHSHGSGHWCLTVDADELLCFPGMEERSLAEFCLGLESEGADGLACTMLDMYGDQPLGNSSYRVADSFLSACPWFDPGPYWREAIVDCPGYEIYGGVRQRLFFSQWDRPSWGLRAREAFFRALHRFGCVRLSRVLSSMREKRPPNLAKVPLVHWRSDMRYLSATHRISPLRLSRGSGVLLHFKFLGDFARKVQTEVDRSEYFDGAREYRCYAGALKEFPDLRLWSPGSVRYRDSRQLVGLGLMTPIGAHPAQAATGAHAT